MMKRRIYTILVAVLMFLTVCYAFGVPASAEDEDKYYDVNGYRYYMHNFGQAQAPKTHNGLTVIHPELETPTDLVDEENHSHYENMAELHKQVMSEDGILLVVGYGTSGVGYDAYFDTLYSISDVAGDSGSPGNYYISRFEKLITDISLGVNGIELTIGETMDITTGLSVSPENAAYKELTWSCDDEKVATIDKSGMLTAIGAGTATLTVAAVEGNASVTCPITVKAIDYEILEGADGEYDGSTQGLTFKGSGDFAKFKSVKVNDEVLDSKSYTVSEGSTIVELKPEYLDTLKDGEYSLEIIWEDGSAKTSFTVELPATGDTSRPVLYLGIMLPGIMGLMAMYGMKRKENS